MEQECVLQDMEAMKEAKLRGKVAFSSATWGRRRRVVGEDWVSEFAIEETSWGDRAVSPIRQARSFDWPPAYSY